MEVWKPTVTLWEQFRRKSFIQRQMNKESTSSGSQQSKLTALPLSSHPPGFPVIVHVCLKICLEFWDHQMAPLPGHHAETPRQRLICAWCKCNNHRQNLPTSILKSHGGNPLLHQREFRHICAQLWYCEPGASHPGQLHKSPAPLQKPGSRASVEVSLTISSQYCSTSHTSSGSGSFPT